MMITPFYHWVLELFPCVSKKDFWELIYLVQFDFTEYRSICNYELQDLTKKTRSMAGFLVFEFKLIIES